VQGSLLAFGSGGQQSVLKHRRCGARRPRRISPNDPGGDASRRHGMVRERPQPGVPAARCRERAIQARSNGRPRPSARHEQREPGRHGPAFRTQCFFRVNRAGLTLCRPLPVYPDQRTSSGRPGWSGSCHIRTLAPQQDTHSADHFIGAREHYRECRTLLFASNCAALHSAGFVNGITYPT
jgi:hypothetical protein